MRPPLLDLDPFDLPAWLGTAEVTWEGRGGLRDSAEVTGRLMTIDPPDEHPCDLLAVDLAFPTPLAPDDVRVRAHQAWQHGQVLLVARGERLVLAVPGTGFTADVVIDALGRLALAVGADAARYSARLRIGRRPGSGGPT